MLDKEEVVRLLSTHLVKEYENESCIFLASNNLEIHLTQVVDHSKYDGGWIVSLGKLNEDLSFKGTYFEKKESALLEIAEILNSNQE